MNSTKIATRVISAGRKRLAGKITKKSKKRKKATRSLERARLLDNSPLELEGSDPYSSTQQAEKENSALPNWSTNLIYNLNQRNNILYPPTIGQLIIDQVLE